MHDTHDHDETTTTSLFADLDPGDLDAAAITGGIPKSDSGDC